MDMARAQLKTLTEPMYYILLSLLKENHGYGIMQMVSELTGGRVVIGAGSLYSLLSRFENEGIIIQVAEENRSIKQAQDSDCPLTPVFVYAENRFSKSVAITGGSTSLINNGSDSKTFFFCKAHQIRIFCSCCHQIIGGIVDGGIISQFVETIGRKLEISASGLYI